MAYTHNGIYVLIHFLTRVTPYKDKIKSCTIGDVINILKPTGQETQIFTPTVYRVVVFVVSLPFRIYINYFFHSSQVLNFNSTVTIVVRAIRGSRKFR